MITLYKNIIEKFSKKKCITRMGYEDYKAFTNETLIDSLTIEVLIKLIIKVSNEENLLECLDGYILGKHLNSNG
jgi:hypothetical protein